MLKLALLGAAAALLLAGCQSEPGSPTAQTTRSEFGCLAGTITGAVAGGLIGSAFGGGSGKVLLTGLGVAGGGFAGNRLACN
jgi:outer membrane lipoprotein SlyB